MGKTEQAQIVELNNRKVDKSAGQGLSDQNFTAADKAKVDDSFQKSTDTLDNILDGATYKRISATEQTKLGGIEDNADVTDAVNVGSSIVGSAEKTTPIDADTVPLIDSADGNALKKLSWANIKATLKTYFDGLYPLFSVGNWNPVYIPLTGSFATMVMDVPSATYIKIANWCFFRAYVKTDNVDITGGSGGLLLSGLPFTSAAASAGISTLNIGGAYSFVTAPLSGYIASSVNFINFTTRANTTANTGSLNVNALTTGALSDRNQLFISGFYQTA